MTSNQSDLLGVQDVGLAPEGIEDTAHIANNLTVDSIWQPTPDPLHMNESRTERVREGGRQVAAAHHHYRVWASVQQNMALLDMAVLCPDESAK